MFGKKKKEKSGGADHVYFQQELMFPSLAAKASHTLAVYRANNQTRYLLPGTDENYEVIKRARESERRLKRRGLIDDIFQSPPTHGISLSAFFVFPIRHTVIFSFGLNLSQPGFDEDAVAREICSFIRWQANELKVDGLLFHGNFSMPEVDLLRCNHPVVRIFWLTAIVSKYANMIGITTEKMPDDTERRSI